MAVPVPNIVSGAQSPISDIATEKARNNQDDFIDDLHDTKIEVLSDDINDAKASVDQVQLIKATKTSIINMPDAFDLPSVIDLINEIKNKINLMNQ